MGISNKCEVTAATMFIDDEPYFDIGVSFAWCFVTYKTVQIWNDNIVPFLIDIAPYAIAATIAVVLAGVAFGTLYGILEWLEADGIIKVNPIKHAAIIVYSWAEFFFGINYLRMFAQGLVIMLMGVLNNDEE